MNQSQRRATALTSEQISYIKGCAKLQSSVWRLCHRDTLVALSDRIAKNKFQQAILALMDVRQRLRKQYLRNAIQKWNKLAQMTSLSNARRDALLRARINRVEAYKRFLLSQSLKNWRIKAARSVEDFLNRLGNFMKLMDAGLKKKSKPLKKQFLENSRYTLSSEFSRRPLKQLVNIYDKCQKFLKNRAINAWRNKVLNMNVGLLRRDMLLKNIIKPVVANDTSVLRNTLRQWLKTALGMRCKSEKMLLHKGHAAFSVYNKWNKANLLKILSTAFNDWRRKAAIKPANYKQRIMQAKPHMLKHNINMNAEDLLYGLRRQYAAQIIEMHDSLIDAAGGTKGLRSMELLESAIAAPFQTFDGEDLYPTIYQKAARLAFGIVKNHAFVDGNKRTAADAMLVFLYLNGVEIECEQKELSDLFIRAADNQKDYDAILTWIMTHIRM